MKSASHQRRGDLAVAAAMFALALAAAGLARSYPAEARTWPLLAAAALAIGAAGAFALALRGGGADEEVEEDIAAPWRAALFVAIVVVFNLILIHLGFLTAGAFALIATPLLLGERRWRAMLATAAVFLVVAYLVFNKLVRNALPPDWFWS